MENYSVKEYFNIKIFSLSTPFETDSSAVWRQSQKSTDPHLFSCKTKKYVLYLWYAKS